MLLSLNRRSRRERQLPVGVRLDLHLNVSKRRVGLRLVVHSRLVVRHRQRLRDELSGVGVPHDGQNELFGRRGLAGDRHDLLDVVDLDLRL